MHLSVDNTNLGMLLPMRAGLGLHEYQQLIINEFSESIFDDVDAHLCQSTGMDAVLFSTETADDGKLFAFKGCDHGGLVFSPKSGTFNDVYQKTLVFIESGSYVYTFFADLKYVFSGELHFSLPRMIHRRRTRQSKRVLLDGDIILKHKDGRKILAKLVDFSPTGASFVTDDTDFSVGEMMLAEFEIPDCGTCETVVTAVRTEHHPGRGFHTLVAIKMALTADQKKKAEHLYLCKKGEEIKKLSDPSRSSHGHPFVRKF